MGLLCFMTAVCFVVAAAHYWAELFEHEVEARRAFISWALRGVIAPLMLWILFNTGLFPQFPPLWPQLHAVRAGTWSWFLTLAAVTFAAAFVITSYWAAATFSWLTALIALRTQNRADFLSFGIFWSMLLLPVAGVITYFGGWTQLGLALSVWLIPVVHFTQADARMRKIGPAYSRAIAKLKFGKYTEAEAEVLRELEKHEEDFEGWMMLAEMYATRFNDLQQADRLIRDVCQQPNITKLQASIALHRLADWHLKLAQDPDAACAALVELCRLTQGTHFARMAQLRISQLPMTQKELIEKQDKKFSLPASLAETDEADKSGPQVELNLADALAVANECTTNLQRDPDNTSVRERFATILAEHLGKIDLALDQIELLLGMPEQPEWKMARWLSLMAKWQLKYRNDEQAARELMERLVHEYPQTAEAFAAQRRLNLMEQDRRFKRASVARNVIR
jgi:hypothetical protein